MSDLKKEAPLMVFVTDANNKSTFLHYTDDLSKNTYTVKGRDFGKHLFKTKQIRANSIEKLIESAPTDTLYLGTCSEDVFYTNVDYYFDPKSFAGYIINGLEAELKSTEKRYKRFFEDAKNTTEKHWELMGDYEKCKKENNAITDKYHNSRNTCVGLNSKIKEWEESYRVLKRENISTIKLTHTIYVLILMVLTTLYLIK